MTLRDDGSMSVGHSARRKLGGPEMYSVASRAFTAGDPGNRMAKRRVVTEDGCEVWWACLRELSCWTMGQVYMVS